MNILYHSVAKSRHSFTSRAGLMVPATLLERLGLGEAVDGCWRRPCRGRRGCTPMIGHIAETGQVVKSGLRKGSVPPAAKNREFFERYIEALPEGARAARLCADATG